MASNEAEAVEEQKIVEEANGSVEEVRVDKLEINDNDADENIDDTNENTAKNGLNRKGNEEKKIFCGGISYETSNEDLAAHFAQFGVVKEVQVKYDRVTGRSRGFAFVEFETAEACKASLVQREQSVKGKQCEIKPAKSREVGYLNKKVFVGGLPGDFPEEELRKHFDQYGRVEEVEWPFDKQTKTRKNFAFVVFEDEESADKAAAVPKQIFASRDCDVKKAVPQSKRAGGGPFPRGGVAVRGGFGANSLPIGGGMRTAQIPMYNTAAAQYAQWWYNAAAYNGGAGWYGGTAATAANPPGQWYNNVAGSNATQAAQAASWYGSNWYGNTNGAMAYDSNGTV